MTDIYVIDQHKRVSWMPPIGRVTRTRYDFRFPDGARGYVEGERIGRGKVVTSEAAMIEKHSDGITHTLRKLAPLEAKSLFVAAERQWASRGHLPRVAKIVPEGKRRSYMIDISKGRRKSGPDEMRAATRRRAKLIELDGLGRVSASAMSLMQACQRSVQAARKGHLAHGDASKIHGVHQALKRGQIMKARKLAQAIGDSAARESVLRCLDWQGPARGDLRGLSLRRVPSWAWWTAGAITIAGLAAWQKNKVGTVLSDLLNSLDWTRKPTPDQLAAVEAASVDTGVPAEVLLAVMRHESSFRQSNTTHDGTPVLFRREAKSWEKWRGKAAPGGDGTWGDYYTGDRWGSYGPMQLMPFWFVGVPGGIRLGEPLSLGNAPAMNVLLSARGLKRLWDKYGNWQDALAAYNSGRAYEDAPERTCTSYVAAIMSDLSELGV